MRVFLILLTPLLLFGCGPRGETKSLEEVLQSERQGFSLLMADVSLNQGVRKNLEALSAALRDFPESPTGDAAVRIGLALEDLLPHAGYTVRPALGEISREFLALSSNQSRRDPGQERYRVDLLVARTYSMLSSELETRGFSL